LAAQQLGYKVIVWGTDTMAPAMQVATIKIVAPYDNEVAFYQMKEAADIITSEWENIPFELLKQFEQAGKLVRPGGEVFAIAQNRWMEKSLCKKLDIPTTPTMQVRNIGNHPVDDLTIFSDFLPGRLKTNYDGYDGKGQHAISKPEEIIPMLENRGEYDFVLERNVTFEYEASIQVARNPVSGVRLSDAVVNSHEGGILKMSHAGTDTISETALLRMKEYAQKIAIDTDLFGTIVVEFFVLEDETVLVNEIAPRPHNSFHASIEAAYTSQFLQHILAICNLPLGNVLFHHVCEMQNLLGGEVNEVSHESTNNQTVHIYGKEGEDPGRKMGHVTTLISPR